MKQRMLVVGSLVAFALLSAGDDRFRVLVSES